MTMTYGRHIGHALMDMMEKDPAFRTVAYFSMEVGIKASIPTYSGGLGVLAGDILKSNADLGVPIVGMTLLYQKGYFNQSLNGEGYNKVPFHTSQNDCNPKVYKQ